MYGSGPLGRLADEAIVTLLELRSSRWLAEALITKAYPISRREKRLASSSYVEILRYDTSIAQKARCWVDARIAKTYKVHTENIVKLGNDYNMASIVDKRWLACHCGFFVLKPGVSDAASFSWANRCWKNGGLSLTHAVVFVVVWHLHANRQHM